jgi:hypothetical protein
MADNIMKVGAGRVFIIKHRASPLHEPIYFAKGAMGSISWGQGDVTKIEVPSDTRYNQWVEVDSFQVSPDRATTTLTVYETEDRSVAYELTRLRCQFDVQLHLGLCEDPRDFDGGWRKIKVFEDARVTSYDTNEQGSLQGDGQATIMEDLAVSARSVYDVLRMVYRTVAASEVGEEVVAVSVCDGIACGECDDVDPSDGCQKIFALTNSATSSPGVLPQVIITTDQYGVATIIERWVTTFIIGENATDAACVGPYYVVISEDGEAIHFANIVDMINENETWTKVTTGIVATKGPQAIWNYSPLLSFIAAEGGYVYQMKDPADGVTTLDAGSNVTDDLNDIDGYNTDNVAAVGDAGAIVYTLDGTSFSSMTAPVGPTDLYAVAYRSRREIWVGGDDASAYVTTDYGVTWTTKTLPGTLTQVDKIIWANDTVGFIAGRSSGPVGKILRTVNGGYTWNVAPEVVGGSIPTVDYINDMDVCEAEPNKLFAGGLADDASDGFIIKGTDS